MPTLPLNGLPKDTNKEMKKKDTKKKEMKERIKNRLLFPLHLQKFDPLSHPPLSAKLKGRPTRFFI